MKIAVIGSGAREHALCMKIRQSPKCERLYCIPGNPGIAAIASCVGMDVEDHAAIVAFCKREDIGFVVVGPEPPLVAGLVDMLEANDIPAFGPVAQAAALEGSKTFMKDFCVEAGIPTAQYACFRDAQQAKAYVAQRGVPIVIKTDGLAAGKGVTVAFSQDAAFMAIDQALVEKAFGEAGSEVVIEEFLDGEEISIFALLDGEVALPFSSARDYKRAYDDDAGPNTGGMGAVSPAPMASADVERRVMDEIVEPVLTSMRARGIAYRGVLYAGVMLTRNGPRLIEFNVRFGDPECQLLMMRLESDLLDLLLAARNGGLRNVFPVWRNEQAVCVVMAAQGYPTHPIPGSPIEGLDTIAQDESLQVFHASTLERDGALVSNGGRVLCISALGSSIAAARARAYAGIGQVHFPGGFYRRDIGRQFE